MKDYGEDLFNGTAYYYSRYRPLYPPDLVRFLRSKFSLDGKGKMLDLGCGDGRFSLRFSDWFEIVIGVDTESEMIQTARSLSQEVRSENMEWFIGDIDKYKYHHQTTFKLVTIAKAFHWMDRPQVLDSLYDMISVGGGIAIIDNYSPTKVLLPWQEKLNEVIRHWYGIERKAGNTTYNHPKVSHQEIILNSKFNLEMHQIPSYEKVWTVESIIGNHYSTSYGAKKFLGEHVHSFERQLKEELYSINTNGLFKEEISTSVNLALKNT